MDCAICKHGKTGQGTTIVTLSRGETVLMVKNVPAEICDNCDEYYLSETITEHLLRLSKEAIARGAEIEILRYAA